MVRRLDLRHELAAGDLLARCVHLHVRVAPRAARWDLPPRGRVDAEREWWIFVAASLGAIVAHWFSALVTSPLHLPRLLAPAPGCPAAARGGERTRAGDRVLPIAAQIALGADTGLGWVAPLNVAELRAVASDFTGSAVPVLQLAVAAVLVVGLVGAWSERAARRVPRSSSPGSWCRSRRRSRCPRSSRCWSPLLIVALPASRSSSGSASPPRARRTFVAVCGAALVGVVGLHGYQASGARAAGEDWRSVVSAVAGQARPDEAIVVFPATAVSAFSYYARGQPRLAGRAGPAWPAVRWESPFTRDISNGSVLQPDFAVSPGVWLVVRAPHGGVVAHSVQESPVLDRLERARRRTPGGQPGGAVGPARHGLRDPLHRPDAAVTPESMAVTGDPPQPVAREASSGRGDRLRLQVRRHWPLLVVLGLGFTLRVVAEIASRRRCSSSTPTGTSTSSAPRTRPRPRPSGTCSSSGRS